MSSHQLKSVKSDPLEGFEVMEMEKHHGGGSRTGSTDRKTASITFSAESGRDTLYVQLPTRIGKAMGFEDVYNAEKGLLHGYAIPMFLKAAKQIAFKACAKGEPAAVHFIQVSQAAYRANIRRPKPITRASHDLVNVEVGFVGNGICILSNVNSEFWV